MTALALAPATLRAFTPPPSAVTPRVGTPRRAAILTALAAAAVRTGNLRAVLMLARTGRPRSLIRCPGGFRWLALAGLRALFPEANDAALAQVLGCRPPADERRWAHQRTWDDEAVAFVAHAVAENEDAELTAKWIWPEACAVAAARTGADAAVVARAPGERTTQPRAISEARKLAVYLTMTEGDVNATAMAAATGLDRKTVKHAVAQMEDRRDDDPALDEALTALAGALCARLDEEMGQW